MLSGVIMLAFGRVSASRSLNGYSLADVALIRLAEINDSPLLLSTVSNFHIHRRHGRQTIPLLSPWL
jgi:hypothetical protein